MYHLEVTFADGQWLMTAIGSFSPPHAEPTRDRIEAYVNGFMSLRAGRVVFRRPDGGIDREAVYEAHDLQFWGARP